MLFFFQIIINNFLLNTKNNVQKISALSRYLLVTHVKTNSKMCTYLFCCVGRGSIHYNINILFLLRLNGAHCSLTRYFFPFFYRISQRVIGNQIFGRKFGTSQWRCVMIFEPMLNAGSFIRVAIHTRDGIAHLIVSD